MVSLVMIDVTRQVTENLMEQLSIGSTQLVIEDEPDCVDLSGPTFGFTLVVNGLGFVVTVRKLQRTL